MSMTAADRAALRRYYDGQLRPQEVVAAMSGPGTMFPVKTVRRGDQVRPLPAREQPFPAIAIRDRDRTFDLYDYLSVNRVGGLLVMKDGKVALEAYDLGVAPDTQWWSCSLAKSFASTLVGVALAEAISPAWTSR